MLSNNLRRITILALAILLVSPLMLARQAEAASNFVEVKLSYDEGATPCITVSPETATINWESRPRRVRWVIDSGSEHYWEIDWKGSEKAGGQPNYFGKKFDIKRGSLKGESDRPQRRGRSAPGASWPYMIRVYEASDSVVRGRLLCELDPIIDWGD